jgi:RNA polymerase sigma-70 factor (ECF subfamily)
MKGGFPVSLSLQEQYDKVYKYCYFKVNNAHLAEDLTQETFLRFFGQNNYISRGKRLAYLYTIARNLCIDSFRKNATLPLPDETSANDVQLDNLETSLAVNEAIAALPNDLQEILLLRFSSELSLQEIGDITGFSRFAVGRKISSALNRLKQFLREEDFLEQETKTKHKRGF